MLNLVVHKVTARLWKVKKLIFSLAGHTPQQKGRILNILFEINEFLKIIQLIQKLQIIN